MSSPRDWKLAIPEEQVNDHALAARCLTGLAALCSSNGLDTNELQRYDSTTLTLGRVEWRLPTAYSRTRGSNPDDPIMIGGLTDDSLHLSL